MTRWHLTVPETIDRDVRSLLVRRGMKKGDLSKFIVEAVRREVLRSSVDDVREQFSDLSPEDAQALADEAVAWTREN